MDLQLTGIILFVGSIFIARIIQINAQKDLDDEKKARLLDISNKNQITLILIIGALFALFIYSTSTKNISPVISLIIYSVSLISIGIFNSIQIHSQLKSHDFPISYIRKYILSTSVRLFGIFCLFVSMVLK